MALGNHTTILLYFFVYVEHNKLYSYFTYVTYDCIFP